MPVASSGVRWGVFVGILDILKGFVPVVLVEQATGHGAGPPSWGWLWSSVTSGPRSSRVREARAWRRHSGRSSAVEPWFALVMLVVFGLLLWRTRWVAGASISACLVLLLLGLGAWLGWIPAGTRNTGAWCVALALIVTFRHRRNIELWVAARRGSSTP